jgi:hypothetical protein
MNPNPVAEMPNFDPTSLDKLSESIKIYYTRMAQSLNNLQIASGGSPGTVVQLNAGTGITLTPNPITTVGTIAVSGGYEPALTATEIGYGSASNLLTGDSTFLWDTANKIFTEKAVATVTRVLTETTDSTSMTEVKQQPFHLWQVTNKVRTPGNIGASSVPNLSAGTSSWEAIPNGTLTGFNKLTVSIWAYPRQYAGGGTGSYVCHCGDSGSAVWGMGYANNPGNGYQCVGADASGHLTQVVTGTLPTNFLNQWHHFFMTWDGTVAQVKYYVDGALIGNGNVAAAGTMIFSGVTGKMDFTQNSTAFGADAIIDEAQVYIGYIGTLADAQFLYNGGAGTSSAISGHTPDAWYHFDDAVGSTTAADSSVNGHTLSRVGTGTLPTFTTGLIVASPTLGTQNVISSKDGAASGETQIVTIGSTNDTVNIVGTLEVNGVAGVGNHPLLDGVVDNDTLAGTVTRGDTIIGNSTPKWSRLAKGASGTVLRSDGTDLAFGAIDGVTITGGMSDVTNGNVSTSQHGFAPKAPADATKYLDGTGAYSVPAGGGGGSTTNYYGSMVQIGQVVTSGSATSATFSSIPSGYTDLVIVGTCADTIAATDNDFYMQLNGDTGSNYYSTEIYGTNAATAASTDNPAVPSVKAGVGVCPGATAANAVGAITITLPGYSQTTLQHSFHAESGGYVASSGSNRVRFRAYGGAWLSSAAINSVKLIAGGTAFRNGSTFTLYGMGGAASSTVGTVTVGRVAADLTNATTTFSNLTGIGPTLVAAHNYTGKLSIKCNNSVAGEGIKLDFNGGTVTATAFWAAGNQIVGGTDVLGTGISTSLAGVINFSTITGETLIELTFSMVVNAGGTFIPRFAENTHVTGTVTLEKGSFMQIQDSP